MTANLPSENTGYGPDPVLPGLNRGGRPRKDGTHADTAMTWREAGFSKRDAAQMRRLGALTDDEFEAAIVKWRAAFRSGRRSAIEYFLPDRRGNSEHERENGADISRLISTLRRIQNRHEGDASERGLMMMSLVKATADLWMDGLVIAARRQERGGRS